MILAKRHENSNPFYRSTALWIGKHFGVDDEAYGHPASIEVEGTNCYPTFFWDEPVTTFNILSKEPIKISGLAAALVIVIYALEVFDNNHTEKKDADLTAFKSALCRVDGNAYTHLIA